MFGLVDTSRTPALGYMEIVSDRSAATLLPIIQAHVAPGTIIHSDQWAVYNSVPSLPNVGSYSAVNHSLHFVDPATGTHTQNVESYWNRVKTKFKRMKGCEWPPAPKLFGRIYVEGKAWPQSQRSLPCYPCRYSSTVPCLIVSHDFICP